MFMTPDKLTEAADARLAEFEEALAPARVHFGVTWPRDGMPQLGVAFENGDQRHAFRVSQREGRDVVAEALAYAQDNRAELLAKVGL